MNIINIEKPRVEVVEVADNGTYGKFVVEPLERGFGTTLGNALRRVLLSSVPGVAPTSIKIDGIQHEFSTVPGVKEDVTEIILNVKRLALKINGSSSEKIIKIDASKEGEIKAKDLICDDEVEIVNPDLHLVTLGKGAKLYAEIAINKGRGYVSGERNKLSMQPVIGTIPVDSIYTPSHKVNYTVENMRVGQQTDFDRLTLEVWTNGVVRADEAVAIAANILMEHINLLAGISDVEFISTIPSPVAVEEAAEDILEHSIEELDLSVRSFNCLKRAQIHTLGNLTSKTEYEMMRVRNLGRKSLDEVIIKLNQMGLTLREDD